MHEEKSLSSPRVLGYQQARSLTDEELDQISGGKPDHMNVASAYRTGEGVLKHPTDDYDC